jgi:cellobiose phosphorylase
LNRKRILQKKFETKYGYFTEDGLEYVIKNYRTPRPWINVISNGSYGLVISQVNGGFSWITHSNLNRITRWHQDLIQDNWGKYIYLRDEDTGRFWSPTFQPVLKDLDEYECRHGIGYSVFHSKYQKIEAMLRVFVPFGDDLEIWTLHLRNLDNKSRKMGVYTYFEWCLGAAPDNHREFHRTFIETEFDHSHQVLIARKRLWEIPSKNGHWNTNWNYTAYFACNESVDGFEGDKEEFIGLYHTPVNPIALQNGQLSGTVGKWNDSIGSLKKTISLLPNQEKKVSFYLGARRDESTIIPTIERYRQNGTIEWAFSTMKEKWLQMLNTTTVDTTDVALNLMTNTWLKYQTISGRIWGRAAYYQQSGAYGFRDQLQDSQLFLYIDPELTKNQILLHANHQFKDGRVLHWWHPITEEGLDGNISDDLLWLPFVTIQYLKETANWNFLKEKVPFYDDSKPTSILDHCLKAIGRVLNRFSKRGLPLILAGDWNDGMSAVGLERRGESIWLAHFLFYILQEFKPILEYFKLDEKIKLYNRRAEKLQKAINQFGWDGNWFWRASKDNGELIGSHSNAEGKIFLNPQTWSVIAGSTDCDRQIQAMSEVEKKLDSDIGPLLLSPAYSNPDPLVGYLSRYAPGLRENGGVYTHAAVWSIWAASLLENSELAYGIYKKLCPINNGMNPDRYVAEPYVTPGNIDGVDSSHYGRGSWSWYTGSAGWLFRVTIDNLIGIQADYNGLLVKPLLPKDWKEVRVKRLFRGTTYKILISNNAFDKIAKIEVFLDGEKLPENIIPFLKDKEEVEVIINIE